MLEELQAKLGISYLFIAHDLAVVKHINDRILVMYLGRIVEIAECEELYHNTLHPTFSIAPGICIALLVIFLNTLGDGVRDALDPRLRGEI